MKISITLFVSLFIYYFTYSQQVKKSDFENFNLPVDTFVNASIENEYFVSQNIALLGHYDTAFNFWSGFSISSMQDSITQGYLNDHSAIAGSGADGSNHYAVAYYYNNLRIIIDTSPAFIGSGFYLTNSTYSYWSMKNGDLFSKKFGGISGSEPDYFRINIFSYLDGLIQEDTIQFYLADYRDSINANDYIISDWQYVSLNEFGAYDSLEIYMESSDTSSWGFNTPAYFCLDNFQLMYDYPLATKEAFDLEMQVYPNPCTDKIFINGLQTVTNCKVLDVNGKILKRMMLNPNKNTVDLKDLLPGHYWIKLDNGYCQAITKL